MSAFRWPASLVYVSGTVPEPRPLVWIPTLTEFRNPPPRKPKKPRRPKPERQPREYSRVGIAATPSKVSHLTSPRLQAGAILLDYSS